ncbi:hypothetical protein [Dyella mobilis]|uniref:Uncharacterized protein n=1 Tax=Dyella mobilis TaxID=1849582 RepID=A0ABS2KED5_9GAMM|nr:hypothetical protein [Dyella mobilis]MBM7129534.1 hypothetical protein [Dyella mobilis]
MPLTRQQHRLADRQAKKKIRPSALTPMLGKNGPQTGDETVSCPCCGEAIYPKTKDYFPRPGTFKQYRCEHCGTWLTIDLRSRIKLIAVSSMGLIVSCVIYLKLLIALGVPVREHQNAVLWPFAIVTLFGGEHLLARYMQRIARWKDVEN